jgi:thioredoxin 1
MKSSHVIPVDERNFQAEVLASTLPVLVDVGARWCPPCRALEPIVDAIAAEYDGRLQVVAIDSDASPDLGARLGIRANPTLIVFHGGKEIRRHVGLTNRQKVMALFADRLVEAGLSSAAP